MREIGCEGREQRKDKETKETKMENMPGKQQQRKRGRNVQVGETIIARAKSQLISGFAMMEWHGE